MYWHSKSLPQPVQSLSVVSQMSGVLHLLSNRLRHWTHRFVDTSQTGIPGTEVQSESLEQPLQTLFTQVLPAGQSELRRH
jgi:hypothetical protein